MKFDINTKKYLFLDEFNNSIKSKDSITWISHESFRRSQTPKTYFEKVGLTSDDLKTKNFIENLESYIIERTLKEKSKNNSNIWDSLNDKNETCTKISDFFDSLNIRSQDKWFEK